MEHTDEWIDITSSHQFFNEGLEWHKWALVSKIQSYLALSELMVNLVSLIDVLKDTHIDFYYSR